MEKNTQRLLNNLKYMVIPKFEGEFNQLYCPKCHVIPEMVKKVYKADGRVEYRKNSRWFFDNDIDHGDPELADHDHLHELCGTPMIPYQTYLANCRELEVKQGTLFGEPLLFQRTLNFEN